MYGEAYQKKTRIITNCQLLCALGRKCINSSHAVSLSGSVEGPSGRYISRTALAGRYPEQLCNSWAGLLKDLAPSGAATAEKHYQGVVLEQLPHAAERGAANSEAECRQSKIGSPDSSQLDWHVQQKEKSFPHYLESIIFDSRPEAEQK